jgi:hypothetical protein
LNGCTDWRRQRAAFAIMFKWLPDTRVEWRDADQCREDRRVGEACRITLAVVELADNVRQGPLGGSAVIGNKELIGLTSTQSNGATAWTWP